MPTRAIEVVSGMDIKSSGIHLIAVELRSNGERRDVVLDHERRGAMVEFAGDAREVEYSFRVHLDASQGRRAYALESPVHTTDASVLIIDPRECYRTVSLRAAGLFDPEKIAAAFVDAQVGPDGESDIITLQLTHDARQVEYVLLRPVNEAAGLTIRIRHVRRSGEVLEGEWQPFDGTTVVVTNPPGDR